MKCPKCNGKVITEIKDETMRLTTFCSFCQNKPDLDWIEVIFGVEMTMIDISNKIIDYRMIPIIKDMQKEIEKGFGIDPKLIGYKNDKQSLRITRC
jgi:transcription elongation factor Elf1